MDKKKLQEFIDKLQVMATELSEEQSSNTPIKQYSKNDEQKNIALTDITSESFEADLESIRIVTPPHKTIYKVGEDFIATGMIVEGKYSDGTIKEVAEFSYSPTQISTLQDTKIKIQYQNCVAYQDIIVEPKEKVIVAIKIITPPSMTHYEEGMFFCLDGLVVQAIFSDGSREEINDYTYSPSRALAAKDNVVLISYKGFTAEQEITVDLGPQSLNPYIKVKSIENSTGEIICESGGWLNLKQSLLVEIDYAGFLSSEGIQSDHSIRYLFSIEGKGKYVRGYAFNLYDYETMELIGQLLPKGPATYQFFIDPIYRSYGRVKVLLSAIEGVGDSITFTAATAEITIFDEQQEQPSSGIVVLNQPYKLKYYNSEKFNPDGLRIGLRYIDGSISLIEDFKYYPTGSLYKGNNNYIVVTYDVFRLEIPISFIEIDSAEGYYGNKYMAFADIGNNPKWNIVSRDITYNAGGVEIGAGSYALSVNLIYKHNMKAKNGLISGLLRGWKLNVHQFLFLEGKDKNGYATYKYIDAENNVHTFVSGNHFELQFYDKEGLGLKLDAQKFIIYDENNNELHFKDSRLVKIVSAINRSEKHFKYDSNGYLTEVYDSRQQGKSYVQLVYNSGLLSEMRAYENSQLIKTIKYVYENDLLKSIKESVCEQERDLLLFTYDNYYLVETIENCISHEAIKLDNYNMWLNYQTNKISYGYIANGEFIEQKFLNYNSHSYQSTENADLCQVCISDEKNRGVFYQLNSRCQIIAQLEKASDYPYYRTLTKDTGKALEYGIGTSWDSINGYPKRFIESPLQLGDIENTDYNGICFWIKYTCDHRRLFAVLKVDGEFESVKLIDNDAQDCWIPVCLDFDRPNQTLKNVTLGLCADVYYENCAICNVRLVKCNSQNLFFHGFTKYHPLQHFSNNELSADECLMNGYYLSENDIVRTIKNIHLQGNNYELSLCDGRVRKRVSSPTYIGDKQINLCKANNGSETLNTEANSWCFKTFSPNGGIVKKVYYMFNKESYSIFEITEFTNGNKISTKTKSAYDYFGRVCLQTNSLGATTKYEYFDNGNLKKITLTDSQDNEITIKEYTEDADENIEIESNDYLGYEYSYNNNLLASIKNLCYTDQGVKYGARTEYGYNSFADRINTVSFLNDTQFLGQNSINYISENSVSFSDGTCAHYFGYNEAHDQLSFGYIEGTTPSICYRQSVSSNSTTNYYYRNNTTSSSDVIKFNYDSHGNLNSVVDANQEKVLCSYYSDKNSRSKFLLKYIKDNYADDQIDYSYDEDNNLTAYSKNGIQIIFNKDGSTVYTFNPGSTSDTYSYEVVPSSDGNGQSVVNKVNDNPKASACYSYKYDEFGRLKQKDNLKAKTEYRYNGLQVIGYIYKNNPNTISFHESYEYDNLGNVNKVYGSYINNCYEYDTFGRLTNETNSLLNVSRSYTYSNNGKMKTFGGNNCLYDNRGRLIHFGNVSYTYDNFGNRLTCGTNKSYEWTRGTLLSRYTEDGNRYKYTYDWQGIRCKKDNGVNITKYYYDGNKLLGEYSSNRIKTWYYYDANGICGMQQGVKEYEFIKNTFGDVVAIIEDEKVVARYAYDAWGNHKVYNPDGTENTDKTFIGNTNPIRYRGYYFDVESGMYYLQTRYYDPTIGQFISPDSPKYLDTETINGLDLYAYCGNNPVMFTDSMGTSKWSDFWRLLAGTALAIVGAKFMALTLGTSLAISGAPFQLGFSTMMYGGFMVGSAFSPQIYNDMSAIGWNMFNSDADLAYNTAINGKVSFYKGVPIVNTGVKRSGTFGAIWLGTDKGDFNNGSDLIKHEWGHVPQNIALGLVRFLLYVGVPSWLKFGDYEGTTSSYYNAPWEASASIMGGELQNSYISKQKWLAFGHLFVAGVAGIVSYLFAIH